MLCKKGALVGVSCLVKRIQVFFNKQPSCLGSNVKNGPKIKQLAKQPPTLKKLLQTILAEL